MTGSEDRLAAWSRDLYAGGHGPAIRELRHRAGFARKMAEELGPNHRRYEPLNDLAVMSECAAALLETHDATGISLDNYVGPRELVNRVLSQVALPPFLPNGA